MNDLKSIFLKLPDQIRSPLETLPHEIQNTLEEIRLKINQPVYVRAGNREIAVALQNNKLVSRELIDIIINNLLNYSIYAYEEDLARGYITIEGGHRVGVCGRIVNDKGNITLIKDFSSVNIRRSREIKGAAEKIINEIIDSDNNLHNTVIVSPPKCGKTTMLRDITRILSYRGLRVAVCDERSEIAGMYRGVPSYDIGPRTDVLDGCSKAEGMFMLIRAMAPDVIVTDEIGKSEDIYALESALCAGVKIITTIHGRTYEDLLLSKLGKSIRNGIFSRIIFLNNFPETGTVSEVKYV